MDEDVHPTNSALKHHYETFLAHHNVSPQNIARFHVWLSRCAHFHGCSSPWILTTQQEQDYLNHLQTQAQIHDWQRDQARQAMESLADFLQTRALQPHRPDTAPHQPRSRAQPPSSPPRQNNLPNPSHTSLLERMRTELRIQRYAIRTEEAYLQWAQRFLAFHAPLEPLQIGPEGVGRFLEDLTLNRNVSASTQNQALNALVFLFREILGDTILLPEEKLRARRTKRLPVVLAKEEITLVLDHMNGHHRLMARLLYGTGMRLMECVRLRVKDVDFPHGLILVRQGKGDKDRRVPLPVSVREDLERHLADVRRLHTRDLEAGGGEVYLPDALARKYPRASREWLWQYVFPSNRLSTDPRSGNVRRHHVDETGLQRAVTEAARTAGLEKPVSCHAFRHSFATHLLGAGYDIRTVQELLGHSHVSTTMIYTHVLNRPGVAVRSPLDI